MRHTMMLLAGGLLTASVVAGCSDNSNTPTSPTPTTPTPTTPTPTPPGGGTGGATPSTAAVTVGDIFFKSALNGSSNPAVDTVAVNGTVTWTWATTEALPHSVQSTGSPSFTSSGILTGSGKTYQFTFTAPGTYQYDCGVHGQMMTGTIVVVATAALPTEPPASTPPPSGY
jgi:plastocyanin